jgi:hypothetical protein
MLLNLIGFDKRFVPFLNRPRFAGGRRHRHSSVYGLSQLDDGMRNHDEAHPKRSGSDPATTSAFVSAISSASICGYKAQAPTTGLRSCVAANTEAQT